MGGGRRDDHSSWLAILLLIILLLTLLALIIDAMCCLMQRRGFLALICSALFGSDQEEYGDKLEDVLQNDKFVFVLNKNTLNSFSVSMNFYHEAT